MRRAAKAGTGGKALRGGRALGGVLVLCLKLLVATFALLTPVLGVWVSSSLAAYGNGPVWLTALAGLLLFPLLPLGWDLLGSWRRKRKPTVRPRVLTFGDRFLLRTLALNVLFLTILLSFRPELGFTALQTRGDWPLEGVEAPWADGVRRGMFTVADRLEWVYLASHDNPYAHLGQDGEDSTPDPSEDELPTPLARVEGDVGDQGSTGKAGRGAGWQDARWGQEQPSDGGPSRQGAPDAGPPSQDNVPSKGREGSEGRAQDNRGAVPPWPAPAELDPVVASMPPSAEKSIESVAGYIGDRVHDERGRVRALHDWVADNVVYDVPALRSKAFPPQDAQTTFRTRKSVCAGYANLMVALGKVLGLRVAYIPGNSRDHNGNVGGLGHAWNAVRLDGAWHLLDATWDAGYVEGDSFVKRFSTDYYLTPPGVFGLDHFPDRASWQLRSSPLSRGEFMRQPMMTPSFHAKRLKLVEPRRSQVTVNDNVTIQLDNPAGLFVLASYYPSEGQGAERQRCKVSNGLRAKVQCSFPASGAYRVKLFAAKQRHGSFPYVGQVLVNSSQ